ncbi:hypothetical protein [Corynebacterium lujinxingii]|uniref:Uncharacterized protein n=1 Tax=Corynebacterium lujinxingii TaxID=2763010 RepID=A0A7H0JWQ6_9CORY|nr:hypothetical protein [Corynebacterium lujinxingii]MBC3178114.1 hypothetical protein [Corynebacterium lujinxingii]NNO09645.1 hypothetical protein [Corynebacterium lujinxingii]QNP89472.1 hypothetical protein IAU68_07100 [Corynebacterium lujinxingii]
MSTKPTDTQIANSLRTLTDMLDHKAVRLTGGAAIYRVARRKTDIDLDAMTAAVMIDHAFGFFKYVLEGIITGESDFAAATGADAKTADKADADDDPLSGLCPKHRREAEEARERKNDREREANFDDEADSESDGGTFTVELDGEKFDADADTVAEVLERIAQALK